MGKKRVLVNTCATSPDAAKKPGGKAGGKKSSIVLLEGTPTQRQGKRLSPKEREILAMYQGDAGGEMIDKSCEALARNLFGKYAKTTGSTVCTGREVRGLRLGIPLPSLALEFLLQVGGLPLSTWISLVGEPGSLKSTLGYDFMRMFRDMKGMSALIEGEDKFSPGWFEALLKYQMDRILFLQCDSIEELQTMILDVLREFRLIMDGRGKENPGPGRVIPSCVFIDSLSAKGAEERQKKIEQEGHATRNFAIEAGMLTEFLKSLMRLYRFLPLVMIGTLHLKPRKDDMGNNVWHTPGGEMVRFNETFRIRVKKDRKLAWKGTKGRMISLSTLKNASGEDDLRVVTRLLWKYKEYEIPGARVQGKRQIAMWDWGWATTNLINSLTTDPKSHFGDELRKAMHLSILASGEATNKAWSKTLGVTKDKPVSWAQMGKLIQADTGLMNELRRALNIYPIPMFDQRVDYRDQLLQARDAAAKEVREGL